MMALRGWRNLGLVSGVVNSVINSVGSRDPRLAPCGSQMGDLRAWLGINREADSRLRRFAGWDELCRHFLPGGFAAEVGTVPGAC